jgi:hypothetical protein
MKLRNNSNIQILVFLPLILSMCGKVICAQDIRISQHKLQDKIKGGWFGQTIGVVYGGATENIYNGTMIKDYVPIEWNDSLALWYHKEAPGLYDDIYVELAFVDVIEKHGFEASAEQFGMALAYSDFILAHANQAARYNILNGIMPPESGHWKNNVHADDIDFQIEADFIGLMSPGMINTSSSYCSRIGHIMNFGDGYYAGVYVAAMYSLALISDNVSFIVNEALKVIPAESKYYKTIEKVIRLHKLYPNDWKRAWFEIERSKITETLHCPAGIYLPINIDATVNSAYVLLGLLYGEKDFYKTIDIATRAGLDSDCNPSTAGGILGTILGYNEIPPYWVEPIKLTEDIDFEHTSLSLNDAVEISFKHALEQIKMNDGTITKHHVIVKYQEPKVLPLEVAFPNIYPTRKFGGRKNTLQPEVSSLDSEKEYSFEFSGTGIVVQGALVPNEIALDYVAELLVKIDGEEDKIMKLPAERKKRPYNELYWNLTLPKGEHTLSLKWLNPIHNVRINIDGYIEFSDTPSSINAKNNNRKK